ncbi:MAG: phenylalanyl-tRNA synthetase subunit beta, partial [Candidatus Collierbacteria bacterium GW2011_GWA1_44_12]
VLPNVNLSTQEPNKLLTTELKIKKYLAALGYSEVFNNSLISKDLIDKTSQLEKDHFKLTNALSADFEYLRVSLLPSLLQNLKNNIGKTDLPISIFELSNIYLKQKESSLPDERSTLSLVTTDNFLRAKGSIEALFHHLNAPNIKISPLSKENIFLQKQRSAQIEIGDKIVGVIGEVNKSISHKLDLKTTPVMTELDLPLLLSAILPGYSYQPISQYPSIIEEITIESKKLVGDLLQSIKESDRLITNVTYLGSFKSKHSFRICFTSQEKNLDQKSVEVIKDRLIRLA